LLESAISFSAPPVRVLTQQVDAVEVKTRTSAAEKPRAQRPVPACVRRRKTQQQKRSISKGKLLPFFSGE
jgi:hypothetical protein